MKKNRGLTLIELLIVVSIIGLLILIGFFLARNQYLKGRDARRKSDIHKIQEAVEEYEKDHDCYPQPELVICQPGTGLIPYLAKVPCDPATGDSYYYENDNDSCAKWYRIFILMGNLSDKDVISGIGPSNRYNFYLASPNAPVPAGTVSTPAPPGDNFYGCLNGVCTPISWDPVRRGPECDPNFQNPTCYGLCALPAYECVGWNP